MKRLLQFIAIGTVFATVEEFLTIVVIRHDLGSYVFTLLFLFPVFLAFVYYSSRLIDRLSRPATARDLVHFVTFGCVGLLIEWFLMGLSPWSNPSANPFLMLVFQLGMFSFWATVAFAPRLFLKPDAIARRTRKAILQFCVPYFTFVYLVGVMVPVPLRFNTIIPLVLFGYLFLNVFYARYFLHAFAARKTTGAVAGSHEP